MKKQLNIEIGARIRKCRETLGYSREMLAEKADLATSFLSTIELGAGSFTAESLIKLCTALGVSSDYLLFGKNHQGDLSVVQGMLDSLDDEYIPYVEQLLNTYLQSLLLAKRNRISNMG